MSITVTTPRTKNMLSAYLHMTHQFRMDILSWMGSLLADEWDMGRELPNVWYRLAKIPPDINILADKGFWRTCRLYLNLNHVKTPPYMRNRSLKQHEYYKLVEKTECCLLRYTCEFLYSHVPTKTF